MYYTTKHMLIGMYPMTKVYTNNGPDLDKKNMEFAIITDEDGKGVNWQGVIDRGYLALPINYNEEVNYAKLENLPNLVIGGKLWTCNCVSNYIYHQNLPYCVHCRTFFHEVWDKANENRVNYNRSVNRLPYLHDLWNYEPQDFEMSDEQLVNLTLSNFVILEPEGCHIC